MSGGELAAIITAIATAVTALGGLLVAILKATREVHVIINQQRTDMIRYQTALVAALRSAGVEIPEDQSLLG